MTGRPPADASLTGCGGLAALVAVAALVPGGVAFAMMVAAGQAGPFGIAGVAALFLVAAGIAALAVAGASWLRQPALAGPGRFRPGSRS